MFFEGKERHVPNVVSHRRFAASPRFGETHALCLLFAGQVRVGGRRAPLKGPKKGPRGVWFCMVFSFLGQVFKGFLMFFGLSFLVLPGAALKRVC